MPFTFRLERVRSVRTLQEELAQARAAEAQERLRCAQEALAAVDQGLADALEALDELKRRDELSAEALYLHSLHVAGLRRDRERARVDLAQAERTAAAAAAELLEAHRAVAALDRLRERAEAVWRESDARKETKVIDELAATRHRSREEDNHGP